ncbi:MAG: dUTP diphosphatase [Firmicutes bacterium]|nr:dUTP diphosphatase [Bacillota bacterium]MDY6173565.1 dUTP diphosphatase [Lentihominibacter sp.]
MKIKIRSLSGEYPAYETSGAAGMDIKAFLREPITLKPMERRIIPTGLFMEIERGYEVQVRARSGLAVKHGIGLINGIGTIDSDYRGEIGVALINLGREDFTIHSGDRIAQMVVSKLEKVEIERADSLDSTERGSGGFGHTGVK